MHDWKTNREILAEFDLHVHGHQEAKKGIINLVNKSKIRYYQRYKHLDKDYHLIEPNKLLLIAPSGQGKTHMVETASRIMNFPLLRFDAMQLAPTSAASGIDVETFKAKIVSNACTLLGTSKAYHSEQGIIDQTVVFIDEIDKLSKPADSSGRWNIHIQENFLTMFDAKDRFAGVSFIFAGAFTGLEKQTSSKSIGFSRSHEPVDDAADWSDEVIKFGLIPELVGRLNGIHKLDHLSKDDYRRILLNLLLPKKQDELLYYHCTDFYLSEIEINRIVDKAHKSGQGVRSLKRELNKMVQDIEFYYEDVASEQLLLENMIDRYGSQTKQG
jgi:ATP-dependent Clp protease ATP-binding subunit ClpX